MCLVDSKITITLLPMTAIELNMILEDEIMRKILNYLSLANVRKINPLLSHHLVSR